MSTEYVQLTGNSYPTGTTEVAAAQVQSVGWGIDGTLAGWIIQSEDITEEPLLDQTQDQKGRMVSMLEYDRHYTLTLQVIGGGSSGNKFPYDSGDVVSYTPSISSHGSTNNIPTSWILTSAQYAGAYNDKKKYTLNLEAWNEYPISTTK